MHQTCDNSHTDVVGRTPKPSSAPSTITNRLPYIPSGSSSLRPQLAATGLTSYLQPAYCQRSQRSNRSHFNPSYVWLLLSAGSSFSNTVFREVAGLLRGLLCLLAASSSKDPRLTAVRHTIVSRHQVTTTIPTSTPSMPQNSHTPHRFNHIPWVYSLWQRTSTPTCTVVTPGQPTAETVLPAVVLLVLDLICTI
jgi:hypothetical protein